MSLSQHFPPAVYRGGGTQYTFGMRTQLPGLTLVALAFAGCAIPQSVNASVSHTERAVEALSKRTDADSLAAAAVLSLKAPASLGLAARAAKAAPMRPDLAWLHAQICSEVTGCDPEPMERHFRELDPTNGAVWFGPLNRAHAAGDEAAEQQALQKLAASEHVDIYWTALVARLSPAAAASGNLTLPEAEVAIIGALAAQGIPAFAAASKACTGERLDRAEVRETCRGVARALQQGDAYITELAGSSIARRVWTEGSPEWNEAMQAHRTLEYRLGLWRKLEPALHEESAVERYLVLCSRNRREQDVVVRELAEAGENPNPPRSVVPVPAQPR